VVDAWSSSSSVGGFVGTVRESSVDF
jgi:hypothetical protein